MSKPTYEEKIQALKESIKHWEEVAKKPMSTPIGSLHCPLCTLFLKEWCGGCPIAEKMSYSIPVDMRECFSGCKDTPFVAFYENHTKENAQAEVIFLKNLLIEMLEKGDSKKKKKEEEWVDITKRCKTNVEALTDGTIYVSIQMSDGFYLYRANLTKCSHVPYEFKVEKDRILKRQSG